MLVSAFLYASFTLENANFRFLADRRQGEHHYNISDCAPDVLRLVFEYAQRREIGNMAGLELELLDAATSFKMPKLIVSESFASTFYG